MSNNEKTKRPFFKKCVSYSINLLTPSITSDGICTACKISTEKREINWKHRI